eukprot:GHVQ01030992.1.p1 GENE.GHVQ01030992.1~~GHVQ01030992.1.p1  ORF type:complete len:177 (-),score=52.52 GHVQ01030992.1:720-1250(-)
MSTDTHTTQPLSTEAPVPPRTPSKDACVSSDAASLPTQKGKSSKIAALQAQLGSATANYGKLPPPELMTKGTTTSVQDPHSPGKFSPSTDVSGASTPPERYENGYERLTTSELRKTNPAFSCLAQAVNCSSRRDVLCQGGGGAASTDDAGGGGDGGGGGGGGDGGGNKEGGVVSSR